MGVGVGLTRSFLPILLFSLILGSFGVGDTGIWVSAQAAQGGSERLRDIQDSLNEFQEMVEDKE